MRTTTIITTKGTSQSGIRLVWATIQDLFFSFTLHTANRKRRGWSLGLGIRRTVSALSVACPATEYRRVWSATSINHGRSAKCLNAFRSDTPYVARQMPGEESMHRLAQDYNRSICIVNRPYLCGYEAQIINDHRPCGIHRPPSIATRKASSLA